MGVEDEVESEKEKRRKVKENGRIEVEASEVAETEMAALSEGGSTL